MLWGDRQDWKGHFRKKKRHLAKMGGKPSAIRKSTFYSPVPTLEPKSFCLENFSGTKLAEQEVSKEFMFSFVLES